jgi:hypothetical protein
VDTCACYFVHFIFKASRLRTDLREATSLREETTDRRIQGFQSVRSNQIACFIVNTNHGMM